LEFDCEEKGIPQTLIQYENEEILSDSLAILTDKQIELLLENECNPEVPQPFMTLSIDLDKESIEGERNSEIADNETLKEAIYKLYPSTLTYHYSEGSRASTEERRSS
jgi:hypothetical protein